MNVAISFLTYGGDGFGGMERATHFLARGLVQLGVRVFAITGPQVSYGAEVDGVVMCGIESLRTTWPTTDDNIRLHTARNRSRIETDVVSALEFIRPDYVLIVDPVWGVLPHLDIWGAIRCEIGLVHHFCHSQSVLDAAAKMPIRDMFAVSESLIGELRRTSDLLRARDIRVLPNCVCITDFEPTDVKRDNIIFVPARMSPEKGIPDVVRAFGEIAGDVPQDLSLCGGRFAFGDSSISRADVDIIVAELHLEGRVRFLPNLQWIEIPNHMRTARIAVLPSYQETFGLAALEAMASATPLVVTSAGNLPTLVGEAACVVEPGDVRGLAQAMKLLLADSAQRDSNAAAGLRRAQNYDATRVAARLLGDIRNAGGTL